MEAYINANIMLRPCILLIYDARNFKGEYLGRTFVCFQFVRSLDIDHPQQYFEAHQREVFELMCEAWTSITPSNISKLTSAKYSS